MLYRPLELAKNLILDLTSVGLSLFLRCIVLVAILLFGALQPSKNANIAGQKRPTRRVGTPRPSPKPPTDYSKFSHATTKHQAPCNSCHKVPTKNWQKVRDFPDAADYPDHDTCVSCHRLQFFKGARPGICTVCHTKVSPRDDARFVFRNSTIMRQFMIEFPHDKHQDVIARLRRTVEPDGEVQFVGTSLFSSAPVLDDKAMAYNNCTICHGRTTAPAAPAGGWFDSFVPAVAAFKSVPTSHASCFNCHWKSQQPVNNDCKGCHKLATPYAPVDSPKRISMRFTHAREQHVQECTACHINITKASSLRGLTPDVPITSCNECHNKDGLRLDVSRELGGIDKNREFVCTYCHTSDVGRLDAPASHYLIAGREPIKRRDVK